MVCFGGRHRLLAILALCGTTLMMALWASTPPSPPVRHVGLVPLMVETSQYIRATHNEQSLPHVVLNSYRYPSRQTRGEGRLASAAEFFTERYNRTAMVLKEIPRLHRKQWEFVYIVDTLEYAGVLQPGQRGLGFAVGEEPLAEYFASLGITVMATDQPDGGAWVATGQHAGSVQALFRRNIARQEDKHRVSYLPVDMNNLPASLLEGTYDFLWSSCSIEHVGSKFDAFRFVLDSLQALRPGGVAVHTTEFVLNTLTQFYQTPGLSGFLRRDIEYLGRLLAEAGHTMSVMDWGAGVDEADVHPDHPPYSNDHHVKLALGPLVMTSVGIVVRKGG